MDHETGLRSPLTLSAVGQCLRQWLSWVMHSGLTAMKQVARTLCAHEEGILNSVPHPITNAGSEGLNSKIQPIKSAARGFRNLHHYRIRILFSCGKMDMTRAR